MSRPVPSTFTALLLLTSLLVGGDALACLCGYATPEQHFTRAEYVFRGRATLPGVGPLNERFDVEVLGIYKGELPPRVEVIAGGTSCGYSFNDAETLVFAERATGMPGRAILLTSRCAGTTEVSEAGVPDTFGPERPSSPGLMLPRVQDPLSDALVQLLAILGLAFATVWLNTSINSRPRGRVLRRRRMLALRR